MSEFIYTGQGWTLTLDTNQDLSAASNPRIYYRKPDSRTKTFKTGVVVETTKVRAVFSASDLDESGDWLFHTYVELSGVPYYGQTYTKEIKHLYT